MRTRGQILAEWAQKGAALGDCGKMCHDCAFRVQPDINHYSETVESALDLLAHGGGSMNCHTSDYEDAGRPCVGYLYAKKYCDHLENVNA